MSLNESDDDVVYIGSRSAGVARMPSDEPTKRNAKKARNEEDSPTGFNGEQAPGENIYSKIWGEIASMEGTPSAASIQYFKWLGNDGIQKLEPPIELSAAEAVAQVTHIESRGCSERHMLLYRIEVPGEPQGKPSPIWNKHLGRMVSPGQREIQKFRRTVKELLPEDFSLPVFVMPLSVVVRIWSYTRRPNDNFVNNNRACGRLKQHQALQNMFHPQKPDCDNMSKFVMDALEKVFFPNDMQGIKVIHSKERDNKGLCHGRTVIQIRLHDMKKDYDPDYIPI